VTALDRDEATGPPHDSLTTLRADVLLPETLPAAVEGQDAIVSLISPHPRRNGVVYIEGTRNLADAAAKAGVTRLVVVSAEGAGVKAMALPLGYRLVRLIPVVARLYPDIARMESELIARTDLDWTVVRAAVLTNGGLTGEYRTVVGDVVPNGLRISRADLAHFLLATVEANTYIRQRVAIAY
jgi:putative NADH-flavin reductase